MHDTIVTAHQFDALTVQPVHVIMEGDEPKIFVDPDEESLTVYGCRNCDEVLDPDMDMECKPS